MSKSAKVVAALLAYDSALYALRFAGKMQDADLEAVDPVPGRDDAKATLGIIKDLCANECGVTLAELRRCLNDPEEIPS